MKIDKIYHLLAGFIITVISVLGLSLLWDNGCVFIVSWGIAIIAGIAKEIWDKTRGDEFDWKDLGFTAFGGAIGTIVLAIGTILIIMI